MDHTVLSENPATTKTTPSSSFPMGNLKPTQADLVSEDPAAFLVAHHILVSGETSVSKIKTYFKRAPEVLELVDGLLAQLESADLISVDGDNLSIKQRFIDIGGDVHNLKRFVPRLFKITSERILEDASEGMLKANREGLRYFVLPNDMATSIEASAIYQEYKTKMLALTDKVDREGRSADSIRLVGAFNCALQPEDFV